MDPVTLSGVIASAVTFTDITVKVIKRIREYCKARDDVPKVLRDVLAQLEVLKEKLSVLQGTDGMGVRTLQLTGTLEGVVTGCTEQIKNLDDMLSKVCPNEEDTSTKRKFKAFVSVIHESDIKQIWTALGEYMTTLMFYFTDMKASPSLSVPRRPAFNVPFERDKKFVGRAEEIANVEYALQTQSRVAIAGIGGIG